MPELVSYALTFIGGMFATATVLALGVVLGTDSKRREADQS